MFGTEVESRIGCRRHLRHRNASQLCSDLRLRNEHSRNSDLFLLHSDGKDISRYLLHDRLCLLLLRIQLHPTRH